jgi:hypothetical protein
LVLACFLRTTLQPRALLRLQPIKGYTQQLSDFTLDVVLPIALGVLVFATLWFAGLWQARPAAGVSAWLSAPLIFGIALGFCVLFSLRPWRFGLAVGILLLLHAWQQPPPDPQIRLFFGIIRVTPVEQWCETASR